MTLSPQLLKRLKSAPPREVDLQRSLVTLLDYSGLLWCHVPNEQSWMGIVRRTLIGLLGKDGGTRCAHALGLAIGKYNKANGLKAGVPDVMVFDSFVINEDLSIQNVNTNLHYNGLAIELKVGKNKATEAQMDWHAKHRRCGWRVEVCYTMDEAINVLRECYPHKVR